MNFRLLLFGALFLLLSNFSADIFAQPMLRGKVMNSHGEPVFQATLEVKESGSRTSSKMDGRFEFQNINAGTYHVKASHLGYEPVEITTKLGENDSSHVVIRFEKEKEHVLDGITVTATRQAARPEDVPQPVAQISSEEVERSYRYNVGEMMDFIPGLRVIRSGATIGADYGISIRSLNGGPSSDKTLVLIDGRPLNNGWDGGINFNMLPTEMVERIEVVKGPASALYGSQATAGVINVIAKDPASGWHGKVSYIREFDASQEISDSDADGYARPDIGGTNVSFNSTFGDVNTDHFLSFGYREATEDYLTNLSNDWENYDFNYRLKHQLTDKLHTTVSTDVHQNSWLYNAESTPTDEHYRFVGADFALKYFAKNGQLNTRIYLNNVDYNELVLSTDSETGFNTSRIGLMSDYTIPVFDGKGSLKIGLDGYLDVASVEYDDAVENLQFQGVQTILVKQKSGAWKETTVDLYTGTYASRSDDYDLTNIALFAQYEHSFAQKLNILAGARLDNHSEFGTVFNPKFGATYRLLTIGENTTTLKANYGKGYRAPNMRDLYSKSLGGYGDTDIEPEENESFDIGIFQRFGDWGYLEVSYFTMKVKNLIINDKVGTSNGGYYVVVQNSSGSTDTSSFNYRKNLGDYSPSGIEVGLKIRPIENITFSASYTYLDPEDFTFQTSENRYNASLYGWTDLESVRLEAELTYNVTGDGYFFDYKSTPYEAFSLLDMMLAASFENYRISLIGKNLADTKYRLWHYEWQPGRTLALRFEMSY
ncbi:TonB-dependent receptor plug [Chloroherpeton thalassium ATCC 35110]|uniref:TonB-dependent receptor plug n=1 Tax=Chloroherpeton thalassium (strain ATCC 35110 / GB-78) TaxID=517418 RepID=B3QUK8_CHLT3|nr:TonB-dependent receptor [Chloroherpeton thalassium]ACF12914.1 TonB-dependent receptor plug [Chloroherpeton thalassium ATCC 35110]